MKQGVWGRGFPFSILGRYQGVAVRWLLLLAACLCGAGCISAGYESWDRTTTTKDGVIVHEKGRKASYSDWREGAKGAAEFAAGGIEGLSWLFSPVGVATIGGGGVLGSLGLAKLVHSLGKKTGAEQGYTQAQIESAGLASAVPKGNA